MADFINGHYPALAIEFDPRKCAVLRDRYPSLAVAEGDCHGMDFRQWHGRVAALHAGVPCPRWSTARRGVGTPPDLSDEVVRIASEIGARYVFLECVPGFAKEDSILRAKFRRIGIALSRPLILDAASVGAPHPRKRCWYAGYAYNQGESVVPIYDEAPRLPPPDSSPWEVAPILPLADGVANYWEMECAGDGQVPLCAAVAWRMLGLP